MISFQPLYDLILVRPDPLPEAVGSIAIPMGALKRGDQPGESQHCFIGTVVATGPGDRIRERRRRDGSVIRTALYSDGSRRPMELKVGDRVVYPRRPSAPGGNCDVVIDGVSYLMFHEEQFAFGVIEE